jgi:hypothetical protein
MLEKITTTGHYFKQHLHKLLTLTITLFRRMFADADNAENMKKCITLPLVTVTILGLLFVLVAIGDHQIQSNACAEITNMYVWCITTGAIGLTLVLFMVIKIVAEKCCVFQFLLNLVISAIFVVQLVSHIIGMFSSYK